MQLLVHQIERYYYISNFQVPISPYQLPSTPYIYRWLYLYGVQLVSSDVQYSTSPTEYYVPLVWVCICRDKNSTEIFRTEPHRFLHLIQSNSYFRTNSNSVRNSEQQIRNRNENGLDIFPTVFYFSTFNSEYPEFKIRFKPNLAHHKSNLKKIVSSSYDLVWRWFLYENCSSRRDLQLFYF